MTPEGAEHIFITEGNSFDEWITGEFEGLAYSSIIGSGVPSDKQDPVRQNHKINESYLYELSIIAHELPRIRDAIIPPTCKRMLFDLLLPIIHSDEPKEEMWHKHKGLILATATALLLSLAKEQPGSQSERLPIATVVEDARAKAAKIFPGLPRIY